MSLLSFFFKGYEGKIFKDLYFTSNRGIVLLASLIFFSRSSRFPSIEELSASLPLSPVEIRGAFGRGVNEFLRSARLDISETAFVDTASLADYKKYKSKEDLPKAVEGAKAVIKLAKEKGIKLEEKLKSVIKLEGAGAEKVKSFNSFIGAKAEKKPKAKPKKK